MCGGAQFDLRNGNIRKKYDSLKYTLKKLEVGCTLFPTLALANHFGHSCAGYHVL